MITLLILLALLVIGLVTGPYLIGQKGYVLIAVDNWTVEMSVVSLILLLLGAIVAFLILEWLIKKIWYAVSGSRQWFSGLSDRKHNKAFTQGLVALDEANYVEADKQLSTVGDGKFAGVELLAAAQAANSLGDPDKAVGLWQKAQKEKASRLAATIHLIEHHIKQGQADDGLALIAQLSDKEQKNKRVVALWVQALANSGQWQTLKDNLSGWKKQ